MNRQWLRLVPLLIVLLLAAALALGLFSGKGPPKHDTKQIGFAIPPFSLPALGQNDATLSPDAWKNRVAVFHVFASWCEYCTLEHDVIMELANTRKVAIYGVAWRDKPQKTIEWINARGNPYQIIGVDEGGKLTIPLGLTGVPETYVLDRDGKIAYHYRAPLTRQVVNTEILPLIDKLNQGYVPAP